MIYIVYKEVFHFSTPFSTNGGKLKKTGSCDDIPIHSDFLSIRKESIFLSYSLYIPIHRHTIQYPAARHCMIWRLSRTTFLKEEG
ncbi:hypothetical protein MKC54_08465 [[Clostridium] innocuum]|nr:hypothetical protein [[Clostridium] innocuum]MCR0576915.1 hypothetical protein [[Clostridium] innocuum]